MLNFESALAGWAIARSIKQGSQCRTEVVFGGGEGDGKIYYGVVYFLIAQLSKHNLIENLYFCVGFMSHCTT
jgi:hypothetical protein